jgi:1-piperideine-2-carboxylate/1-pyrroline-2-carboxylate reductase [NAD(P)H]
MTYPVLNATQTSAALPFSELVNAVARAAMELDSGTITAPERLVIPVDARSVLLCMPATAADISVAKIITVHAGNMSLGLPAIQGEVIVMDTATGKRLMQLDGPTVTARRTAAVSVLGIQTLLGRRPRRVLLIGTGAQAQTHVAALVAMFGITHIDVQGTSVQKAQAFCDLQGSVFKAVMFAPAENAESFLTPPWDVVIALTTSRTPIVPDNLPAHTLAIGVGAFKPDMAELGTGLLHSRAIVVDSIAGARHEAGDLLRADIDWSKVRALSNYLPGRSAGDSVPVFKTVGQAAWDLAAARVALLHAGL